MSSRTVIVGAIALAAILAATLWYQLVPREERTARATPTPTATVAPSAAPTPSPSPTPSPQTAGGAPTPISATTGPVVNLFLVAVSSVLLGASGLGFTWKRSAAHF